MAENPKIDLETIELLREYTSSKETRVRNLLVERLMPFARKIARIEYARIRRRSIDVSYTFEEAESDAYFGLFKAIEKYSPEKSASGSAYLDLRIKGEIKEGYRRSFPLTRRERNIQGKLLGEIETARKAGEEIPSAEELKDFLGDRESEISPEIVLGREMLSLEQCLNSRRGRKSFIAKNSRPDQDLLGKELERIALEVLDERVQKKYHALLIAYMHGEINEREAGEIAGVGESRISQVFGEYTKRFLEKLTEGGVTVRQSGTKISRTLSKKAREKERRKEKIADIIQRRMKELGMSQRGLTNATGLHKGKVYFAMNGRGSVNINNLRLILSKLDIPYEELDKI